MSEYTGKGSRRCVRCGSFEGGSVWCRDDHDHSVKSADHRLNAKWREQDLKDAADAFGDDEESCTHCNGEGLCCDGSNPLGNCPDEYHRCHACNGSGNREDQVIF